MAPTEVKKKIARRYAKDSSDVGVNRRAGGVCGVGRGQRMSE